MPWTDSPMSSNPDPRRTDRSLLSRSSSLVRPRLSLREREVLATGVAAPVEVPTLAHRAVDIRAPAAEQLPIAKVLDDVVAEEDPVADVVVTAVAGAVAVVA